MEKNLLITGASSDVGIKVLENIYMQYNVIYVQYRTLNTNLEELLTKIEKEKEVVRLKCDFSRCDEVKRIIDFIVEKGVYPNNIIHLPAPKAYNTHFHKDVWENYELGWEISVHSIVEILKVFLPKMAKNHYGRVVFMLTSCTIGIPPKYQSSYVTIKYALLGLMKTLSAEYAEKGITVNGISPDMMDTKFLSDIPQVIVEKNAANSPIKRNIYIEEIIPIVSYMLSDLGAAMTGQNIGITAGNR